MIDTTSPTTRRRVFVMDCAFESSLGRYPLEVSCKLARQAGVDAYCHMLWHPERPADLRRLERCAREAGLTVHGAWAWLHLGGGQRSSNLPELCEALRMLPPQSNLELAIGSIADDVATSDGRGDPIALNALEQLLRIAQDRAQRVSLYAHVNCWMEDHRDALRLCRALGHPLLGIAFSVWHWYARQTTGLRALMEDIRPWLQSVNLCGATRRAAGLPTIEPLDSGELDLLAVMGLLHGLDYRGPIGIQAYGVGGDPVDRLGRAVAAIRRMEDRLGTCPPISQFEFRPASHQRRDQNKDVAQ